MKTARGGSTTSGDNPKKAAYNIQKIYGGKGSLPSMATKPTARFEAAPVILTVVPLEHACMVGFSVADEKDAYQIEYTPKGGDARTVKIEGLRGAAKIHDLASGSYVIRIRAVRDGQGGPWSAPSTVDIK
jgi:hypothetical protein